MQAMVVTEKGMALEARETPAPGRGEVRVKVHACGVCHSDHFVTDRLWPGLQLPRVPGHEVAGVVDAVGEGVTGFEPGARVGVGWHGGHDGTCETCLRGHFLACREARITGISFDGGYGEHVVVAEVAVAKVPDGMDLAEAAPILCAGVTTFNALRNAGARSGDLVAVAGLGGLGHLGVQFARAMGFEVIAVSRGRDKEAFARKLGAHHYVDAASGDPAAALTALGGASVILATAPDARGISALVGGLAFAGALVVVGAPFEPLQVGAIDLISGNRQVRGWASGTASDSTDTMAFAARHGIEPMVESFPLARAGAAVERMMSGQARFRAVLDMTAA
jgi:D-arabinose 1-dehydrogenase-like Zn-dependent alcohol dehydrogenase